MAKDKNVYSISSVGTSLSDDQSARSRRYLISMGFRLVCFAGAVVVDGVFRWLLLGASLVLPWVAVVVANAGKENGRRGSGPIETGKELH